MISLEEEVKSLKAQLEELKALKAEVGGGGGGHEPEGRGG